MWLGFFLGLDHRVSVCQASGTMKTEPAAREGPSFSIGWSYRTGSEGGRVVLERLAEPLERPAGTLSAQRLAGTAGGF